MKRKLVLVTVLTTMGISGAGLALAGTEQASEPSDQAEVQMFQAAKMDLNAASRKALEAQPGKLMKIGFDEENGKGVWEANHPLCAAEQRRRTLTQILPFAVILHEHFVEMPLPTARPYALDPVLWDFEFEQRTQPMRKNLTVWWLISMPRSCSRSSTLRSESGNRTYNINAGPMISGLVLA